MEEEKWDEIQEEKRKRKKTSVKVRKQDWKEKKESEPPLPHAGWCR